MIESTPNTTVHEIRESSELQPIWGLTFSPDALVFHPPTDAPPIPVPRQSLDRRVTIVPNEPFSQLIVRLPGKVKFQLSVQLRTLLEDWLRTDWRRVLAGELKTEALFSMIGGAVWMAIALLALLGVADGDHDAFQHLVFSLAVGGFLLGVALLGRLVVRPVTLFAFSVAYLATGAWIGYSVSTGQSHWAWLVVLVPLLTGVYYLFKRYTWFKRLETRFP